MESYVATFLTPVLTGLVVWLIERKKTKRDELKERAEEVNAEVNVATMELAYASAMALKRGEPNGEVEKALTAYNSAKKHLDEFYMKQKNKLV